MKAEQKYTLKACRN